MNKNLEIPPLIDDEEEELTPNKELEIDLQQFEEMKKSETNPIAINAISNTVQPQTFVSRRVSPSSSSSDAEEDKESNKKSKKRKATKKNIKFKPLDDIPTGTTNSKRIRSEDEKKEQPERKRSKKLAAAIEEKADEKVPTLFKNAVFTVSGIGSERSQLRDMVVKYGGKYSNNYNHSITHVIVSDSNPYLKSDKVQRAFSDGMVVVKQSWLFDCEKTGKKVPLKKYLVKAPESEEEEEEAADNWSEEEEEECSWRANQDSDGDYVPPPDISLKYDRKKLAGMYKEQIGHKRDNTSKRKGASLSDFVPKSALKKKKEDTESETEEDIEYVSQSSYNRDSKQLTNQEELIQQSFRLNEVTSSQNNEVLDSTNFAKIEKSNSFEWNTEEYNTLIVQKLYKDYVNNEDLKNKMKYLSLIESIFDRAVICASKNGDLIELIDDWEFDFSLPKSLLRLNKEISGDKQRMVEQIKHLKEIYLKIGASISGETLAKPDLTNTKHTSENLPNIFSGLHFYLTDLMEKDEKRRLVRMIITNDGDLSGDFEKAKDSITHIVAPSETEPAKLSKYQQAKNAKIVEPLFIDQCIKKKRLVSAEPFLLE